jgi:hypothetical protein
MFTLCALLGLAGCASVKTTFAPAPGTQPPATVTPGATCATLLPGAGSATAGDAFGDVVFPTGAVTTARTQHLAGGSALFTIYLLNACAPNTTANDVRTLYATKLLTQGWVQSDTLPFDGGFQKPCGDPFCWKKDHAPRYVGLESVKDAGGNAVTFTLRLFTPPPAPNCPADLPFDTVYSLFIKDHPDVPLPPLTVYGVGDGSTGLIFNNMCSAGDANAITTFFQTELTKLGWRQGSFHGVKEIGNNQLGCSTIQFQGWISPDMKYALDPRADATGNVNPGVTWGLTVYTGICP